MLGLKEVKKAPKALSSCASIVLHCAQPRPLCAAFHSTHSLAHCLLSSCCGKFSSCLAVQEFKAGGSTVPLTQVVAIYLLAGGAKWLLWL